MPGPVIQRLTRQLYGLGTYRWVAGFLFLVAGFGAFREQQAFIALGFVVFNVGIAGVLEFQRMLSALLGEWAERSDCKTRYAIIVAAEWSLRGDVPGGWDFWEAVERLVVLDLGEPTPSPAWWKVVGLVTWNFTGRVFGDVVIIGAALLLTSTS